MTRRLTKTKQRQGYAMTAVDVFGYAGLLVALVALIALAMRGVDIIFAALFSSLIVIISNGLPLATALNDYFAFGQSAYAL